MLRAVQQRHQDIDTWIWDFDRETLTRLTFDPGTDAAPRWSPDGLRVAFGSRRGHDGDFNLFWKAADGTGTVERLTESASRQLPCAFSPDGMMLVFEETHPETGTDLYVRHLRSSDAEGKTEPLLATEFNEQRADISPDGRWLAYQSNASGQAEIYVRPFPNVDAGRWQISRGGGTGPRWSPAGGELFYLSPGSQLTSVPVETDPFAPGNPEVVFEETYVDYDVSPDGNRFLMIKRGGPDGDTSPTQVILVQNWFDELNRLVPVDN